MDPRVKMRSLGNLLVKLLLFGVFLLVFRFVYVVTIHGEKCDAGDFCFFSKPEGAPALPGAGVAAGGRKAFVRRGEGAANPEWSSREWRRAVDNYSAIFQQLLSEGYVSSESKVLCVDAGAGQEVFALKEIGVPDAIGVSKKKSAPLVAAAGDLSQLPFGNETFDFVFSAHQTIEQSKRPGDLALEIVRTLKPKGFLVIHTLSARDVYSQNSLLNLFSGFKLVRTRDIDRSDASVARQLVLHKGEDSHILFPDKKQASKKGGSFGGGSTRKCTIPDHQLNLLRSAEPLIKEEPLKPWITLKRNVQNIKYLPTMVDINFKSRYVYVDVGARSYGSSIGSWFRKQYPKQNKTFDVYAIEADRVFHAEYATRKGVSLLPFAAWVRNETLSFEINEDPDHTVQVKGRGMGRIQPAGSAGGLSGAKDIDMIQGFDFADWLKNTVSATDFVVMKMDVEGTEFDLIPRLFETGAICLIDELFLECHYNRWQKCCPGKRSPKYHHTYEQCLGLFSSLRKNGVLVHQWW